MTKTIERARTLPPLPEIDDATRREFLIGAAGLLLLPAGCGGDQGDGGGASGETRTVDSLYGKLDLPAQPQRLVPGYTTETDYALVLGIPMAAAPGSQGAANRPFGEYQREAYPEELEGLERVTTFPEANLEQIAAVQPDCILDQIAATDEGRYERLSEIAPTFVFQDFEEVEGLEAGKPNWRGSLRTVARAFGGEGKADKFINDYEARVEDLRRRLAGRWSGATFAAALPWPEYFQLFGRDSAQLHQVLFEDLGLTPASVVTPDSQELSLESLPEVDADVLFLALVAKEGSLERDRATAATYTESPLWQKIPAIEKDQVYEFDAELFFTGPLTAAAFLDVVENSLLG